MFQRSLCVRRLVPVTSVIAMGFSLCVTFQYNSFPFCFQRESIKYSSGVSHLTASQLESVKDGNDYLAA